MNRLRLVLCALLFVLGPTFSWAQPINVRSSPYLAVGDGITDDTAAFYAAITAAPAQGAEIYIPAGHYKLTGTLNVTNKSIAWRGEGQRLSILRFDGPGIDGIQYFSTTTQNTSLTIKGLSILRGTNTGGMAIRTGWAATPGWHGEYGYVTATIEDVNISKYPFGLNSSIGWDIGIALTNATNAKVRNFTIYGRDYGVPNTYGIILTGKSISDYISDGDISYFKTGIAAIDTSEGFHVNDVEIIAVNEGISLSATSGSPGTSIQGCHINSITKGIVTFQWGDLAITNNLIYKFGTDNWMGIHVTHGDSVRISGNYIVELTAGGASNGIVLEGNSVRNIIQGNITEGMDAGVWLVAGNVADNIVMGNLNRFGVVGVLNNGTGNYVVSNP